MHEANGNRDKRWITIKFKNKKQTNKQKKKDKISFVQKIMNQTKYKGKTKKYIHKLSTLQ